MRERYRVREKILAYIGAAVLLLLFSQPVYAQSGKIYTCNITRCYSHPVTGVIEDAGGESSYATGQGMVESAVGITGMLEITDGGDYYLTVRMSMMDYTTGHSFLVQKAGDSDWMSTTVTQVSSATDSNGTTTDFRILVPSESCVVRCSMNVTPMGRDVIFYFYPGSYTEVNTSGMTAGIVTETSAAGAQEKDADTENNADIESEADTKDTTQTTGKVADTSDTTSSTSLESTSQSGRSASGAESSLSAGTSVADGRQQHIGNEKFGRQCEGVKPFHRKFKKRKQRYRGGKQQYGRGRNRKDRSRIDSVDDDIRTDPDRGGSSSRLSVSEKLEKVGR